jgi:hypothetical protein
MDLKRWRVPMGFMMVGAGIAVGQDSAASGSCYECSWDGTECRTMTAGEGDWGSTSCVGEGQGYENCNLSEGSCTG